VLYAPSRFEILKNDFARIAKVISIIKTGKSDQSISFENCSDLTSEKKSVEEEKDLKTEEKSVCDNIKKSIDESVDESISEDTVKDDDFHSEQMGLF